MNRRTLLAAALGGLFALGPQAHTPTTADGGFTALPTALLGAADAYGATATLWVDVTYNWDRSEFLIVFAAQNGVDAAVWDIRARRFRHDGEPIGASFVVSTGHFDIDPHVAHDLHTNRYLVVWTRVLPDGSSGSVIARLLDSSGTVLGSEIAISNPAVSAGQPDVAARNFREQSGVLTAFVVVWKQTISSGGNIVKRERVSGDGLPLNEATLSENPTTSVDRNPRIAYNPVDNRFLVVWSDDGVVRGLYGEGLGRPWVGVHDLHGPRRGAVGRLQSRLATLSRRLVRAGRDPDAVRSDRSVPHTGRDACAHRRQRPPPPARPARNGAAPAGRHIRHGHVRGRIRGSRGRR